MADLNDKVDVLILFFDINLNETSSLTSVNHSGTVPAVH